MYGTKTVLPWVIACTTISCVETSLAGMERKTLIRFASI
jgi:hypothetical protein